MSFGGSGRDWQLQADWPIPFGWWLALAVAAVSLLLVIELLRTGVLGKSRSTLSTPNDSAKSNTEIRGRWWLFSLRLLTLLVVLWMLGRWQIARFEVDLPDLLILVDRSESMSMPMDDRSGSVNSSVGGQGGLSRWSAAGNLLTDRSGAFLRQLSEDYRLRLFTVGQQSQPLSGDVEEVVEQLEELEADQQESRLGDAIAAAVSGQRGRSTAAVVLISDGVVTDGLGLQQAGQIAASARLPIFAVKTGSEFPPPNVKLEELLADSSAMVGDLIRVVARIRWESGSDEWSGTDQLLVALKDSESDRVLAQERLNISSANGSGQLELMFTATDAGLRRLRVEVEEIAGEIQTNDNSAETTVDVRDESFRVLLVQGGPSYEFRFLKHLLERATNRDGTRPLVELISVLQAGDPRYADQDRAARRLPPVDNETLEKLDLIILSDCDPNGLGRVLQNRIVDLVTGKGTSLVVIAGPEHLPRKLMDTPLESLLPVDPKNVRTPDAALRAFSWVMTPLGSSIASLQIADRGDVWQKAPPLYWLAKTNSVRPGARVLLETGGAGRGGESWPIVVSQLAGNGQVWLQLTDESFRLRAADIDSELYERYWLQLIRSLAQGRQVSGPDEADLVIDGERFYSGTPIPFEIRLGSQLAAVAGGQVTVAVSNDQGQLETFTGQVDAAGRGYRGLIQNLPAGSYRAVLASPLGPGDPASDTFVVESNNREMAVTSVDLPALRELATASKGGVVEIAEAAEELSQLLPKGRAMRIKSLEPVIIWNHWLVCSLMFGLLCLQWIMRRRLGGL